MKNFKMNTKLLISFGVVLLMLIVCSGVAIVGMNKMGAQIDQYANKTVPNIESVWQMRRDMVSAESYLLSALIEEDPNEINECLEISDKNVERLVKTLETFSQNTRTDKEILSSI